jgi:hypothetical protein
MNPNTFFRPQSINTYPIYEPNALSDGEGLNKLRGLMSSSNFNSLVFCIKSILLSTLLFDTASSKPFLYNFCLPSLCFFNI